MAQTPEQQPEDNLFVRVWRWVRGTWQGRIVGVALLVALAISLYWWPDSGFDTYQVDSKVQRAKTLWDWLDLLGVPVVLAVGGFAFSSAERKNDSKLARERTEEDRKRSDDTLRQALCQDYLDRMSELLLDKDKSLAKSLPEDLVREVARARTLTVLRGLGEDGARKGSIVQFLYETGLINGREPIIELKGANLQKADLSSVVLNRASLSGARLREQDLSEEDLGEEDLGEAYRDVALLLGANLSGMDLSVAYFNVADLSGANLSHADLSRANLSGADLREANLIGADFHRADLRGANLSVADLTSAIVTDKQLASVYSLEGATMPNGSKYAGIPPTASAPVEPSPDSDPQDTQSDLEP